MSLEGPKKEKSSISKVVGGSPELREEALRSKEEIFDTQEFKALAGEEREKTKEEMEMIAIANYATNLLRRKFGLSDFDIPPKNVHVIPKDKWTRSEYSDGAYGPLIQGVLIRDSNISKLYKLSTIIHELVHFKSYNALQIKAGEHPKTKRNPEGKPELSTYRIGFEVVTRDGEKIYFNESNEAMTEELTKKLLEFLIPKLLDNPIFKEEMALTEKIVNSYSNVLDEDKKRYFDGDTIYAQIKKSPGEAGGIGFRKETLAYKTQRKMLNSLIDKVWKAHKNEFKSSMDVFDVFAAAYMTGNMLRMGRLIEETFGKGSFRKIGGLDMGTKKISNEKKPAK